jgi:enediyne biosynthesis protein CalE5
MESGSVAQQADGLRTHLHRMWGSVAGAWADHAEYADVRGEAMTLRLVELTAPAARERVLELACGPGGVGLAVAQRVPAAEVVLSDVAAEMTAIAAARAAELGLANVTTRELDLERIDAPDGSYDVVLCREGLMLVPDPELAAREIARVVRPGGRLALTVWGPRQRNPWLGIVFESVSKQLGTPVPPPGIPGPFSLDDADRLREVLLGAGLADVGVAELEVPYRAASAAEWWTRTLALAGPLAQMLAALPADAAAALRARAIEAIGEYATPGGLEIPGVALVASATRR